MVYFIIGFGKTKKESSTWWDSPDKEELNTQSQRRKSFPSQRTIYSHPSIILIKVFKCKPPIGYLFQKEEIWYISYFERMWINL